MPAPSKKYHTPDFPKNRIPDFSPESLRSLTDQIESSLKSQGNRAIWKDTAARPKARTPSAEKKRGYHAAKSPVSVPVVQATSNGSTTTGKQRPTGASKPRQGKKRSRDGYIKEVSDGMKGGNASAKKFETSKRTIESEKDNSLVEDIRALGGTRDDFDLIANIESESEMEDEELRPIKNPGNVLQKEISQLVRQLGVDKVAKEELMAISASEVADEVQELEENRNHDMTPSNKELLDINLMLQNATSLGRSQRSVIFRPQSDWLAVVLPPLPLPTQETFILPSELLDRLHNYARALLENENIQYAKSSRSASSAHQFYSTIMSTGTLSDKISALTLSVQESPIHNMRALESLVGLAGKRSRGQAVEVLGALKDLFGPGNLLPSARKLKAFASQPALSNAFDHANFHWTSRDPLPGGVKEVHLISWAFEDWLKSTFFEVLKIIETWCNDEVVFARGKAVDYVCQLLKEKPEQEANLLRLLVNKLGDSDKKIASKTSFSILQLEAAHPLMKPTIIAAIESDILFRPSQSLHAKYYASITLNQTVLSSKESGVAKKLLDVYFNLFIKLLEKPEEEAQRVKFISINKKGEVQGGGGSAGKKALRKVAEEDKATTFAEDLREKMLSAVLAGVNRAIPFTDTNDELFQRQLDMLFKVTHSSNFNTSIQALMLIQQLNGPHQGSMDRFYRTLYESLLDPRLLTSSKQALYLNLVFRALKSDLNVKRVKAFTKRLLQVAAMHQTSFVCATIYLLRELEGLFANLEAFIDHGGEDSEGEEDFQDVQEQLPSGTIPDKGPCPQEISKLSVKYDGRRRDPQYSNADRSALWEAIPFVQHYHPSVALFATRLLTHGEMPPKPDLSLNTLIHFLDRFIYRNPKATNAPRGSSLMQPMAAGDSSTLLVSAYSDKPSAEQPVNSEAFWKQASKKVNADEVFFHKYFSTLGRGKEQASWKKTEKKAGFEDSVDEADEDEIWEALVEGKPELDEGSDSGLGDEDVDGGMGAIDDDDFDLELVNAERSVNGNLAQGAEGHSDLNDGDDDAFLDSDDEVLSDLEEAFGQGMTSDKAVSVAEPEHGKRSSKRRRLKSLPTFALADDYAKMLEEDDD